MSDHRYTTTLQWQRQPGEAFTDRKYSRRHELRFDGGHVMPASSSPLSVKLPYSDPAAVDPEEGFVASISSCHMLWFLDIACRAGFVVDGYVDEAVGVMEPNAQNKLVVSRVTLRPRVRFHGRQPTREEHDQLHHRAHEECFIANSVKSEIVCEPALEG
jgi:organic hydroperoxide reductase OsmC/OhrA